MDFLATINGKEILSTTLILFAVIDILGSIPMIINLRKKYGTIHSEKASFIAAGIMVAFLFLGESILKFFGLDIPSFAIAGSIVLFLIGLEMILGLTIFHPSDEKISSIHVMPLAFPLIAGAGTLTTLLSLRSTYAISNILIGVAINVVFVYIVLKSSEFLEKKIGPALMDIMRKVFGIILLSISIKIFLFALEHLQGVV